jgi:hypothetical protein
MRISLLVWSLLFPDLKFSFFKFIKANIAGNIMLMLLANGASCLKKIELMQNSA